MTGCAIMPDLMHLMRLVVITEDAGAGRGHLDVAKAALAGGCRAVQLRDKELGYSQMLELAKEVGAMCRRAGALFFVNDRADIAASSGAHGVHLGVEDVAVAEARRMLGPAALIGYSPEGEADARRAVDQGATYLGIGPAFATGTKGDAGEPIGIDGIARWCRSRIAPVIAVGGIDVLSAGPAMDAGAAGVAVVSAVTGAGDMESAVRSLLRVLRERRPGPGAGGTPKKV